VVAETVKVFAVAIAARAIERLTVTFPVPDEEEVLDEPLDDEMELDVEEDEEDDEEVEDAEEELFPPLPQADRNAAQANASMPPSNTETVRRSIIRALFGK